MNNSHFLAIVGLLLAAISITGKILFPSLAQIMAKSEAGVSHERRTRR